MRGRNFNCEAGASTVSWSFFNVRLELQLARPEIQLRGQNFNYEAGTSLRGLGRSTASYLCGSDDYKCYMPIPCR